MLEYERHLILQENQRMKMRSRKTSFADLKLENVLNL